LRVVTVRAGPAKKVGGVPHEIEEVYEQHLASVWRYVRSRLPSQADAEDATSEVFARAAAGWHRYDPSRASVGAWLTGIAHHVVADWWRHRPEVAMADAGAGAERAAPEDDSPEAAAVRGDTVAEVQRHLAVLTERERAAVALRFAAGLSSAEVGEVLGVSDAGARMLVYRAVTKLRGVLAGE
jgi:RNA polymerase sigma factor (sigma-70 family)